MNLGIILIDKTSFMLLVINPPSCLLAQSQFTESWIPDGGCAIVQAKTGRKWKYKAHNQENSHLDEMFASLDLSGRK